MTDRSEHEVAAAAAARDRGGRRVSAVTAALGVTGVVAAAGLGGYLAGQATVDDTQTQAVGTVGGTTTTPDTTTTTPDTTTTTPDTTTTTPDTTTTTPDTSSGSSDQQWLGQPGGGRPDATSGGS